MILKNAATKLFKIREEASRSRPGADEGYDPHEKPFLDHLEDLRMTLMRMIGTLAVTTVLCFTFHKQIFEFLQFPARNTKMGDGMTLAEKIDFFVLAPHDIIMLMLKISFFTAVVLAMPLLVFFMFQFILPGLRQIEKKMIIPGAGIGFVLFLTGASFAFFLAAPIALKFFFNFQNERIGNINPSSQVPENIAEMPLVGMNGVQIPPFKEKEEESGNKETDTDPDKVVVSTLPPEMKQQIRTYMMELLAVQSGKDIALQYDETRDKIILANRKAARVSYQIGKYFEFITRLTLVFGLSFQLPVVVTILVKLELLTARVMRSTRT